MAIEENKNYERQLMQEIVSPKNQRELFKCVSKLEQELQKIGNILGTRCVASSYRAVSAVWYCYSSIYNHFEKTKTDKNRSSTERAMYCGLSRQFSSSQILFNLAIMYDILAELSMLSEVLQNRETTVVYADKLIRRSIRFFETLKEKPGTKSLEAYIDEKDGNFNNVPISNNPKIATMNHKQLITSVINNLTRRMFTTKSSHESTSVSASSNCKQQYDSLLSDLNKVLETDQCPTEKSVRYGEEIQNLCKRFKLNKLLSRLYRGQNSPSRVPKDLTPLMNCTKQIPCSSSEYESGYSLINQIMTDLRLDS